MSRYFSAPVDGLPLTPGRCCLAAVCDPACRSWLKKRVKRWQPTTGDQVGRLALGASETIGQYLLPKLVAGFLREHPRVQISVMGGNTQTILEALVDHRVQLCLIEGPAMRRDVRVEPFMEDHMGVRGAHGARMGR